MRLLASALCLLATPALAAAPDVEVTVAWGGLYLPNAATEISVRLSATRGTDATVSATTAAATSTTQLALTAGEPVVAHLPLAAPAHGVVDIAVTVPGANGVHERLRLRPAGQALRVLATQSPPPSHMDGALVTTRATSMPTFPQGYEVVSAMVVDGATLAMLTTRQLAAFQAYVAGCGRTGLLDVPQVARDQLGEIAGCGGSGLTRIDQADSVARFFDSASHAPPLPSAASIGALLGTSDTGNAAGLLFALASLSVLAVGLLARAGAPLAGLIATPVLGTLAVMAAANSLRPTTVDATYADMVSGDRTARFVKLIRVEGGGPADTEVAVGDGWIRPRGANDLRVEAVGTNFDDPRLKSTTAFLERRDIVLHGARTLEHPLRLTMDGILPSVTNTGDQPADGVLLAWRDGEYALPRLKPGQTWSPDATTPVAPEGSPRRLLRARSGERRTALMAPLHPAVGNGEGWVLIRAAGAIAP